MWALYLFLGILTGVLTAAVITLLFEVNNKKKAQTPQPVKYEPTQAESKPDISEADEEEEEPVAEADEEEEEPVAETDEEEEEPVAETDEEEEEPVAEADEEEEEPVAEADEEEEEPIAEADEEEIINTEQDDDGIGECGIEQLDQSRDEIAASTAQDHYASSVSEALKHFGAEEGAEPFKGADAAKKAKAAKPFVMSRKRVVKYTARNADENTFIKENSKWYLPTSLRYNGRTYALVYEKKDVFSVIVRLDERYAERLQKRHPAVTKARFPKGNWYVVTVSDTIKNAPIIYRILKRAKQTIESLTVSKK